MFSDINIANVMNGDIISKKGGLEKYHSMKEGLVT